MKTVEYLNQLDDEVQSLLNNEVFPNVITQLTTR